MTVSLHECISLENLFLDIKERIAEASWESMNQLFALFQSERTSFWLYGLQISLLFRESRRILNKRKLLK